MPFTMIILNKCAPRGRVISVAVLLLGAKVTGQWLPSLVVQFQPFSEPPHIKVRVPLIQPYLVTSSNSDDLETI